MFEQHNYSTITSVTVAFFVLVGYTKHIESRYVQVFIIICVHNQSKQDLLKGRHLLAHPAAIPEGTLNFEFVVDGPKVVSPTCHDFIDAIEFIAIKQLPSSSVYLTLW